MNDEDKELLVRLLHEEFKKYWGFSVQEMHDAAFPDDADKALPLPPASNIEET